MRSVFSHKRNYAVCSGFFSLAFLLCIAGFPMRTFAQAPDTLTGMKGFYINVGSSYNAAFKYWTSPKFALVGGVSLYTGPNSISQSGAAQTNSSGSLFGRFQYFLTDRKQFMPYLSAGGNVGTNINWNPGGTGSSLNLGLGGGIGMECFLLPWFSVAGELNLSGTYSLWRSESNNPGINPYLSGSWSAGLGNSGIIFTIYF